MTTPINCPRTLNPGSRYRLSKSDQEELEQSIIDAVTEEHPQSVRHVFYQLCHLPSVGKTESGYRRIQRLVLNLRKQGRMRYSWIADGTRYRIKPTTYGSVEEALEETARYYRRALWRDVDVYVEVWCESDSIAGVLDPITDRYDISLMATRGFSSHTFLHAAGVELTGIGKPTYIYYVGDWDPSGKLIGETVASHLRNFAPSIDIEFERLLINPEQIEAYSLPTKPTKHSSHSRGFGDSRTVEAEAMPAGQTREILENAILQHIDEHQIDIIKTAEYEEKEILRLIKIDPPYPDGSNQL